MKFCMYFPNGFLLTYSKGVCDTIDGQCACKGNVLTGSEENRTCDECKDGFFGLSISNGLGCDHCQCDVGGTEIMNRHELVEILVKNPK